MVENLKTKKKKYRDAGIYELVQKVCKNMDDFLENQLGFLEFPIETAQTISAIDVTMIF
jgi:hypothetical protein